MEIDLASSIMELHGCSWCQKKQNWIFIFIGLSKKIWNKIKKGRITYLTYYFTLPAFSVCYTERRLSVFKLDICY